MQNVTELHALDVPVALRLAEAPDSKYADLGADLGISASTAFSAVQRLQFSGLLRPASRKVNWLALREFLAYGLRYAFPVRPGAEARGIPTSHAAPPLADHMLADDVLVWPAEGGTAVGKAISPLYPPATELPRRCPSLYELLALADALRVGRARERRLALEAFDARLGSAAKVT
jgi:hypothetical protein